MKFESLEFAKEEIEAYLESGSVESHILEHYGIDTNGLHLIRGKQLHDYMVSDDALWSEAEECLVFLGNCNDAKFLYYMGAEKEAELVAKFGDVTVYQGIDYERIERYLA